MKYIDEADIGQKIVLLRADFNVPVSANLAVRDDQRIRACLPTIRYLLSKGCKVVIISHLGRPEGMSHKLSLRPVAKKLHELVPTQEVMFIDDLTQTSKNQIREAKEALFMLENIRFYPEEQENESGFAKKLSELGDIFVNDAFSVSHRKDASVVGLAKILPSYGGLLLKKELGSLERLLKSPEKPFVAVLGGSKISTKLLVIEKLSDVVDTILLGGGIANTFLFSEGIDVGKSIYEKEMAKQARELMKVCEGKNVSLVLPIDVVVGEVGSKPEQTRVKTLNELTTNDSIYDIGPRTGELYSEILGSAKTIVWNGPVGYFENPTYQTGTDAIYTAVTKNSSAFSVTGGGDTLTYLGSKTGTEKISFISTGGGAMLEYLAKGTLAGIEALG